VPTPDDLGSRVDRRPAATPNAASSAAPAPNPEWQAVDEAARLSALMSALSAEYFVLQSAASSTISEAAARSSLYVLSLSSSLIAMGVTANAREIFLPFAAVVFPVLFMLGVFTVIRLVDTALESMQYLSGFARTRAVYRTFGPIGAAHFATRFGRWPEIDSPAMRLGALLAFLGTTASMIAFINNVVAGAGVTLLVGARLAPGRACLAIAAGVGTAVLLTALFLAYQHWRFATFEAAGPVSERRVDAG
jgi:hypothetical protein